MLRCGQGVSTRWPVSRPSAAHRIVLHWPGTGNRLPKTSRGFVPPAFVTCVGIVTDDQFFVADVDLSSFGPYYGDHWSDLEDFEKAMARCREIDARWYATFHHKGVVEGRSDFLAALDAFHDTPEIKLITCRQEGGAAMMADAYGRLTGQPGICMLILQ